MAKTYSKSYLVRISSVILTDSGGHLHLGSHLATFVFAIFLRNCSGS